MLHGMAKKKDVVRIRTSDFCRPQTGNFSAIGARNICNLVGIGRDEYPVAHS
jgi:hypothetical protein